MRPGTTPPDPSAADLAAMKARLYAALKHEKSCTCGECSGGLNAVDSLVARCEQLERERDEDRSHVAALYGLEAAERRVAELEAALRDLIEVSARYMDTGRGDLDGNIDVARAALEGGSR